MFELSGVNYEEVLDQGDSILVRVITSSSYRGFELSGIRVIGDSSYRDYTVYKFNIRLQLNINIGRRQVIETKF